jgi:PAS domain S-box-containing protein
MTASRLAAMGVSLVLSAASLWLYARYAGVLGPNFANFMPHGYCYMWDPRIVWLHVITDALIGLSYYAIPVVLLYFIRKRRDLPFNWIFWMFAGFILACGSTHFMEIWNIWHGDYVLAGVIKAMTAVLSVLTAAMLIPLTPKVIALPGLKTLNRELEAALKDLSEQKFALDQHAIVATTDVQGTITYVNDKFCAISKYSGEELIGQNHRLLNSGEHSKEFFREMYRDIAGGRVWRSEICNRAKDGSIYWVDTTVIPFLDSDGKPRQYMAIRADITARKLTEELRERLAAVVDSSDDAIISTTLDGTISAWNHGAEKIYGYEASEVMGKSMLLLIPSARASEEVDILTRIKAGENVEHFETVRVRKDGTMLDVSVTISPVRDGRGAVVGASKIARNITGQKADEREIRRLNEDLEERIAKRTKELEVTNRELEAFSYSVSHDLRSPLRHIAGFSKILVNNFGPVMAVEAREYLQFIEDAVRRMGWLVEGLLSLAKLGQQSLELCSTELNAIVDDVISILEPECEGREVEWRIAKLPTLDCDPILMAQVFQNLLGNALKYSRGRAKPVIEVGSIQQPGKPAIIFVRDNGAGFNRKDADRLFGVFQRFHTNSEFEGTGVGLATVQRIILKHGGTIWAESEPDHGATFYFALQMTEQIGATPKTTAAS